MRCGMEEKGAVKASAQVLPWAMVKMEVPFNELGKTQEVKFQVRSGMFQLRYVKFEMRTKYPGGILSGQLHY